ncbi:hypothetical protein [Micromonospora citrea]|uniref:hypothetical protein n=1 Tax=Micromonospora citrea TaxID=47855 RepID=UPI000B8A09A0|nr:hypothetical protein [Micromonospora citrea]
MAVARQLPAETAEALMTAARTACTGGLNTIGIACAVITALSAAISLTVLREHRGAAPSGDVPPTQEAEREKVAGQPLSATFSRSAASATTRTEHRFRGKGAGRSSALAVDQGLRTAARPGTYSVAFG